MIAIGREPRVEVVALPLAAEALDVAPAHVGAGFGELVPRELTEVAEIRLVEVERVHVVVGAPDAFVVEHAVDERHHRQEPGHVLGVVVFREHRGEVVGRDVVEGVGIEVAVEMEDEVVRGDQRGAVGVGERVRVARGGDVAHGAQCGVGLLRSPGEQHLGHANSPYVDLRILHGKRAENAEADAGDDRGEDERDQCHRGERAADRRRHARPRARRWWRG